MKRMLAVLRGGTFALILLYVAALGTYLLLRWQLQDGRWWMALLNTFANLAFLPLIVLLPLALLVGARRGLLLLLPVVAVAAVWFAPYFAPKATAFAASETPQLRILTSNLWGGNRDYARNPRFDTMGEWLGAQQADVLLLQEVPLSQRQRADGILGLGERYPEQRALQTDSWTRATLTRLPVVTHDASSDPLQSYQRTVVRFAGRSIAIYNVHNAVPFRHEPRVRLPISLYGLDQLLSFDPTWRDQQIDRLLAALDAETLPYIVGGDFNMSDRSFIYQTLAARMTDTFLAAGDGPGTSWRVDVAAQRIPPALRIDYLWVSDDFAVVDSYQGPPLGSDHLPLVTTLMLRG